MAAWGQLPALPRRSIDGRFTSESSRNSDKVALTLSATTRREQMQQQGCRNLFDHLVGELLEQPRHVKAKHLRRFYVD
jgi:hypothetical protein